MDHLKRVTDEFTRRTQTFAVWAENVDADVGVRFASGDFPAAMQTFDSCRKNIWKYVRGSNKLSKGIESK